MEVEKFVELSGLHDLQLLGGGHPSRLTFLFFYADWNQDSMELRKIVKESFEHYIIDCNFGFVDSDLEPNLELCAKYNIETVPSAIMVNSELETVKTFEEIDPVNIHEGIESQIAIAKQNFEIEKVRAFNLLDKLTKNNKVVVFLDSSSNNKDNDALRQLLQESKIDFQEISLNNKAYENLTKWVQFFSNGQSLPQLYVEGQLIGNLSKVSDLIKQGELIKSIPRDCIIGDIDAELQAIIKEERLILFVTSDFESRESIAIKSQECLKILQLKGLIFRHLDLKGKQALEFAAKKFVGEEFSIPFLFFDGKPWKGGDDLLQTVQNKELKEIFEEKLFREDVFSQIKKLINSYPIFVFMKGNPDEPQCGFTSQLLEILEEYKVDYRHFNILEDHLIREKIKEYSNWKTFPQIYVKGELIGGLDIIREMIEDGSFEETIRSAKHN